MVKQSLIITIFFLTGLLACQENNKNIPSITVSQLVEEIAKDNVLKGPAVGIAGARPEQWNRYQELREKATDKELSILTNDTNAVVRCYALQALAARNTKTLFPIVLRHLSDTATVHTLYGCLYSTQKVGDFYLETILAKQSDITFSPLSEEQKAVIDSLLLFESKNNLEARIDLLYRIQPLEKYYQRIKQLATEERIPVAVVALSRYRKQQDIPLIAALLGEPNRQIYGFAAIVNFPDASFFSFLQHTLKLETTKNNGGNDERLELLYQAIVQYRDQPSRQLLATALQNAKGIQAIYHADYLHQALKKYPAAIYDGLLKPNSSLVPASRTF